MLDNINPDLWGPHCWKFLNYLATSYPEKPTQDIKNNVKNFINSLKNVIPCEKCREHFQLNLKNYPLDDNILNNKNNLIEWLIKVHNEVNTRTGKKIFTRSDFDDKYLMKNNKIENIKKLIYDEDGYMTTDFFTMILLIIIIIIIIAYLYSKR